MKTLKEKETDPSDATITCSANTLKFLARAYLCNISELSTEKMSADLLAALKP